MKDQNKQPSQANSSVFASWFFKRILLVIWDLVTGYLSFYFVLKYRVIDTERIIPQSAVKYFNAFNQFAPWYAVLTIAVFLALGLYMLRFKYVGFNDVMRIFIAHVILLGLQIGGTMLFLIRMPLTYYFFGTAIHFLCTCFSRFFYKGWTKLRDYLRKPDSDSIKLMIVGSGDTSYYVRSRIESAKERSASVVCVFSTEAKQPISRINGVPVVSDESKLASYVRKYGLGAIYIADPDISAEQRRVFKDFCSENNLGYRDYSDVLNISPYNITLGRFLEYANCPVRIRFDGGSYDYPVGREADPDLPGVYFVNALSIENDRLIIDTSRQGIVTAAADAEWVKQTEQETGEQLSFF